MVRFGSLSEHPAWILILVKVNHLLLAINSAVNILIYSYKVGLIFRVKTVVTNILQDFKFRSVLMSAFRRKKSFSTFGTSVRSSFGSSRYHTRHSILGNSSRQHNGVSSSCSTADTIGGRTGHVTNKFVKENIDQENSTSENSRNLIVEKGEPRTVVESELRPFCKSPGTTTCM